jgi:hypothetical protein
MSAPFSPIITTAALVLPETTVGMIEQGARICLANQSSAILTGTR